jgi:hypothetical protein
MRTHALLVLVGSSVVLLGLGACGGKAGPVLDVDDVNVRNLCNKIVSGETEERCDLQNPACVNPAPLCLAPPAGLNSERGFCRQCESAAQCAVGLACDYGWCHQECAQDSDCTLTAGTQCIEGFCRRPHFTDFAFSNTGDENVLIDLAASRLLGAADACAYSRIEWSIADPDAIQGDVLRVKPSQGVHLRVYFRPTGTGFFRGRIDVVSNSETHNPLPLLLCGQSVDAACAPGLGDTCPDCVSNCTEADFRDLPLSPPTCP